MQKLLLCLTLTVLSLPVRALQTVDVADGHTVTVRVSARELTRIAMAPHHRIVRVWGLEEQMKVEPDTAGGQVFLRPAPGHTPQPFSFFVKDEAGATYTLVAVPVDMPADAVVLRPVHDGDRPRAPDGIPVPYVEEIAGLVRGMARGKAPDGYTVRPVSETVPLWKEARLLLVKRYAGELTGEVYRLTNVSKGEMRLDERELGALASDLRAVALDRLTLAPGEETRLYLVRRRP